MFEKTFVYKTPLLCNAECWFCLSKAKKTNKIYKYPKHKLVWELLSIKKKWFKYVILVWWESTIIENLDDYIKVARKLDLEIIVTTNGIVLSDYDYMKYLHGLWLNHIIFSFHSHIPEVHDELVWIKWAFEYILQAMQNARKLNFQHISTSTVICKKNQNDLVDIIQYIRNNTNIYINNFCNLEISMNNTKDYNAKSNLFPNLSIIKQQINLIHQKYYSSKWSIWLQNLPLCAFSEENKYLTHEFSWKERYFEDDFNSWYEMNHRIKSDICDSCNVNNKCKWFFPYFNIQDLQPIN